MSVSYSGFEFQASEYPITKVLDKVQSMGYPVQRTKALAVLEAGIEVGYWIVATYAKKK